MEKAENKKEYQIGTFSDDLSTGVSNILSEGVLEQARIIVELDRSSIIKDIAEQIDRLDSFIKKEIGAIPRTEDLANWMFDKKKLTQTGDYFPKITDEEIIEYSQEYVTSLKRNITTAKHIETKININTFQWLGTPQQLFSLYSTLITEGFICSSTPIEAFNDIFSGSDISTIREKVLWLKMGDNKFPRKKSVSDLIDVLVNKNLIDPPSKLLKTLSGSFTFLNGDSKFTYSNLAKEGNYSTYRLTFEDIVANL